MKLKIKGLDCGYCALKIEEELKKDDRIKDAKVDFISQTITYRSDVALSEIKKVIKQLEPGLEFIDDMNKYTINFTGLD